MTINQTVEFDREKLKIIVDMTQQMKKLKRVQFWLSVPAVLLLCLGYSRYLQVGNGAGTTTMMLGLFIGVVANILYPRMIYSNQGRMNAGSLGKAVHYTLTEYELYMSSEFGDLKMTWEDCEKIKTIGKYIVLSMNNHSAIVLEKKQLTDEEVKWVLSHKTGKSVK